MGNGDFWFLTIFVLVVVVWSVAWARSSKASIDLELMRATIEAGLSFVSIVLPIVASAMLLRFEKGTGPLSPAVVKHLLYTLYWLVASALFAVLNLAHLPTLVKDEHKPIKDKATAIFGIIQLACLLIGAVRLVLTLRELTS